MTIVPTPSDPTEWHALRLRHVGGSEVSALWGLQRPYQHSLWTLWHIKGGHIPDPGRAFDENEDIELGREMEPVIIRIAARRNNWHVDCGLYATDDTTPGLGATLDGVISSHIETSPGLVGRGVLEAKKVRYTIFRDDWGGNAPPFSVLLQLLHGMAATGYQWGAIGALVGGDAVHTWKYRARPRIIDEIRNRVGEFWRSVEAGKPPATDGTDSTADALRALYPPENMIPEEVVIDDPAAPGICQQWLLEGELRRSAAPREQALKAYILAIAQGHMKLRVRGEDDGPDYIVSIANNHKLTINEVSPG